MAVLAAGLAIAALSLAACRPEPARVRLVLISLDTLRWDSFAGEGDRPTAMPRLAAWAAGGAVFQRFFAAAPSTQPSHASMLTGLHPWQHGVSKNGIRLADERDTVVEKLRAAGFSTSAVVASFPVSRSFGFAQGFDEFDDTFETGKVDSAYWRDAARSAGKKELAEQEPFYSLSESVAGRAVARIDAATADRQFFWFHFFDPHSPYGDAAGKNETSPNVVRQAVKAGKDPEPSLRLARRLYDADIGVLDEALERLLQRLAADEGRFETHVVVVSDHGEAFGEEGAVSHSRYLTYELVRVPLIVRSPRVAAGARSDVAGSVDVAPTLLALAGVEGEVPGRSLLTPPPEPTRALGMRREFPRPQKDLWIDGEHELPRRLFFQVDENGRFFRGNAKDLAPPPGEKKVSRQEGRDLRKLFKTLEKELREAQKSAATLDDPETRKKLKALGYAG